MTRGAKTGIMTSYPMKGVERMKRLICALLCMAILLSGMCFAAAEDVDDENMGLSREEEDEIRSLDEVDESMYIVTGKVYPEPTLKDFNRNSKAVYTARLLPGFSIFSQMDVKSKRVVGGGSSRMVDILYVGLQWLIVRTKEGKIGYTKREWYNLSEIEPVDPVNTPPFNVQKHTYVATTATSCHVRKTMDPAKGNGDDGNNWVILKPGTKISIWKFYDGWAMVNYMRSYGYIDPNELKDLTPVSPTDEELYPDCPIGAYTSYYKMIQIEQNLNRIHNIKLGCGFISVVINPGEVFNANGLMGRYNAGKGYKKAGVLVNGTTTAGYGGGTCQVSSTLSNVVVQLPKLKIIQRRAHGPGGASYLPIHCDAAVGNSELNQRWINNYPFPVRIEASSNDDGALCVQIFRAD